MPDNRPNIIEITWDEEALTWAAMWGLSVEDCESIVRHPQRMAADPRGRVLGHPVLRHYAGDVIVIAGYKDRQRPQVLFVTTRTGLERSGSGSTAPAGSGSNLPKSLADLRRRIKMQGYDITLENHPKIVTKDGRVIGSVPNTPSDHRSLPNAWRQFCRAHGQEMLRAKEKK